MNQLRRYEDRMIDIGRNRLGQPGRFGIGACRSDEEVCGVLCVSMLIEDALVIRRPFRRRICAVAGGYCDDAGASGIVADSSDFNLAISRLIGSVGVPGNVMAVVR